MTVTQSRTRLWDRADRPYSFEVTSRRPPAMIYPAICMPGRFSAWCEALLAELITASGAPPVAITVAELEQLGREVLVRDLGCALVVSRQPDRKICDALTGEGKKPFLFVIEDPRRAVGDLMRDQGVDFLQAVRTVAGSCATVLPLIDAPNGLPLGRDDPAHRGAGVAGRLARHFGLPLDDSTIARVAAQPRLRNLETGIDEPLAPASFDAHRQAIMEAALAPYANCFRGEPLRPLVWPRDLFLLGDRPDTAATQLIDVTGPSRCLLYGPYIHLPEGSWSCNLLFGCTKEAVGLKFVADIVAGVSSNLAKADFQIDEPGIFEIEVSFAHAGHGSIEVRIFNAAAAFEGHVALGQVTMVPLKGKRLKVS
jgi:hypothetical protein